MVFRFYKPMRHAACSSHPQTVLRAMHKLTTLGQWLTPGSSDDMIHICSNAMAYFRLWGPTIWGYNRERW